MLSDEKKKTDELEQNPSPSSGINPQPKGKAVVVVKRVNGARKRITITKTETVEEFKARTALVRPDIRVPTPEKRLQTVPEKLSKKQRKQLRGHIAHTLMDLSKQQLIEKILSYQAEIKGLNAALKSEKNWKKKDAKRSEFYHSKEWRELRYQALKAYGRTCAFCRTTKGVMHVDHIKPRSRFPHLELAFDNLQILCEACNLGKSNKDKTDWREP